MSEADHAQIYGQTVLGSERQDVAAPTRTSLAYLETRNKVVMGFEDGGYSYTGMSGWGEKELHWILVAVLYFI